MQHVDNNYNDEKSFFSRFFAFQTNSGRATPVDIIVYSQFNFKPCSGNTARGLASETCTC